MMVTSTLLVFKIFLLNGILAEWIDMPQFSDEKKVYRMPIVKQDHFYKFAPKYIENQFPYVYQNVTYKSIKSVQTAVNESEEYDFYTVTKLPNTENVFVTDTEKYDETTVPLMVKQEEDKDKCYNESFTSYDTELLNHLPVDLLKNVHHILKSQPTSSEGKIQFLKTFENTLITEIETRLANSVMINREKRGTEHYDHGYDHEHATGFPSIEGALMAISFLTFAVYLVRLVMLLFRNINNPPSTTTGATLLLGRRKKSINKFDDEIAIILGSLHSFSSKF
ncbi:unnamed protein product [Xylocopa violacea]|uniref:Uncharacterized protein n=1 Tax=Xylocopa violacea TaxID=135666 RepID=A0ABP1PG89_XYLVO